MLPAFLLNRLALLFLTFILYTGCSEPLYWAKPNASPDEFERDVTDCQEEQQRVAESTGLMGVPRVSASFGTGSLALERCLAANGWFLVRKPVE